MHTTRAPTGRLVESKLVDAAPLDKLRLRNQFTDISQRQHRMAVTANGMQAQSWVEKKLEYKGNEGSLQSRDHWTANQSGHVSRLKTSGAANNHSFHGSLNEKLLSTRLESISVDYVTTTTSSTRMAKHFTPHIQALTCRCCTLSGETLTAVSPYIHGKWTTLSRTSTSFIMNGAWLKSTVEGMSFLIAESQS